MRRGNIKTFWTIAGLGIVYIFLMYYHGVLTGRDQVDGVIGVVFGLYICSRPAAYFVDLLFFKQETQYKFTSKRRLLWLVPNLLVMLIGWSTIFIGVTRLVVRGE